MPAKASDRRCSDFVVRAFVHARNYGHSLGMYPEEFLLLFHDDQDPLLCK